MDPAMVEVLKVVIIVCTIISVGIICAGIIAAGFFVTNWIRMRKFVHGWERCTVGQHCKNKER